MASAAATRISSPSWPTWNSRWEACLPGGALKELTRLSLFVSEIANITPLNSRPFVGRSAFAHKGGVHVHAVLKNTEAYEHIRPELIGNHRRVLVSDLSGKSNIEYKAAELGLSPGDDDVKSRRIVEEIKHMENEGYTFEAADGPWPSSSARPRASSRSPSISSASVL